ncbi:MAG: PKD domain-containing protein, partial [Bacteroidia bacterium]
KRKKLTYAINELLGKEQPCDSLEAKFTTEIKTQGKMYLVTISDKSKGKPSKRIWTIEGNRLENYTESFTQKFDAAGSYPIQLEIENAEGCKHTFGTSIVLSPDTTKAEVAVHFSYTTEGLTVQLKDSSLINKSYIKEWYWNLGDNNTSRENNVKHTYKEYGRYNVCLTVTLANGKRETACMDLSLQPAEEGVQNLIQLPMMPYVWSGEGSPEPPSMQKLYEYLTILSIAVCVAGIILPFLFLLFRRIRRKNLVETEKHIDPPYFWPIKVEVKTNFYDQNLWNKTTTQLRKREEGEKNMLDIPQSLQATMDAGGYPTLCYKASKRPVEYLFLIDRASYKDHQAIFFQQLAEKLGKEDIYIDVYFHNHHFQYFWKTFDERPAYLEEIVARHPKHRLVIMGDGEGLVDPYTGELAEGIENLLSAWKYRALMTSVSTADWGMREVAIAKSFLVSPSNLKAFSTLAERFDRKGALALRDWINTADDNMPNLTDEFDVKNQVEELKAYLGEDLFLWLSACACYPELHWDMTIFLGKYLSETYFPEKCTPEQLYLLSEENLLKLIRLPYFRVGEMNEKLRWELVHELVDDKEEKIREAIITVLDKNAPPDGTRVADKHYINLVTQRWQKDKKNSGVEIKEEMERLLERDEIQDYVVLEKLKAQQPLGMKMSDKIRDIVFRQGLPLLGMKSWIIALAGLITFTVALLCFLKFSNVQYFSYFNPEDNQSYYLKTKTDSLNFYSRQGILDGGKLGDSTMASSMNHFTNALTCEPEDITSRAKIYYNRAISAHSIYKQNTIENAKFLQTAIEDFEKAHTLIPATEKLVMKDSVSFKENMELTVLNSVPYGSFLYASQGANLYRYGLTNKFGLANKAVCPSIIKSLDITKNDKLLATINEDNHLYIYQTQDLTQPFRSFIQETPMMNVQFSPTQTMVMATNTNKQALYLWQINGKEVARTFNLAPQKLVEARFSNDGSRIITAMEDSTTTVWEVSSGAQLFSLSKLQAKVVATGFCWNDHLIYVADNKGKIYLWENTNHASLFWTIDTKVENMQKVSFSHDGSLVAVADGNGKVEVFSLDGKQPLFSTQTITPSPQRNTATNINPNRAQSAVNNLQFLRNGQELFVSTSKGSMMYQFEQPSLTKSLLTLQVLSNERSRKLFDKDYEGKLIVQGKENKDDNWNLFIDNALIKYGIIKYNLGWAYLEARQFKKAYEILSEIPIDTKDSQLVRVQLAQAVAQMLLAEKEM